MDQRQKGEGFPGQRIVVLPRRVVAQALQRQLLAALLPTDVGYFPAAAGHWRQRGAGADQAIFIYCIQGRGWCELDSQRHAIARGDLLVVPPGVPHAYGADEKEPWTIPWVHAAGTAVPAYLAELGITVEKPVVYLGEDPQLLELFEEVLNVLEHGYAPAQLLYAAQTLAHLVGAMIWHHDQKWRSDPDPGQKITQSIQYMKKNLARPLHVSTLAALANLSCSHYAALFKRQTGYAPIDYLIRLRMHRACQLLDTTNLSVKAISAQLGYDDAFYFSRLFKAVNEASPSDYRLMHKG
jgi:AraC family transcriptional regulator of arabinose operon